MIGEAENKEIKEVVSGLGLEQGATAEQWGIRSKMNAIPV